MTWATVSGELLSLIDFLDPIPLRNVFQLAVSNQDHISDSLDIDFDVSHP